MKSNDFLCIMTKQMFIPHVFRWSSHIQIQNLRLWRISCKHLNKTGRNPKQNRMHPNKYSRPLAILLTGSVPSGRTECQARFLSVDLRLVVRTQVAKLSTPIFSGGCGESTSTTFQVVDGATLSHQSNPVFYHISLRNPHPSKYCTGMGLSSLVSEKCGTACATLAAP